MSDGGDIEVENSSLVDVLPKDVIKEVGNIKLFNKWDYDVEVRDISLTYVGARRESDTARDDGAHVLIDQIVITSLCATPSMSPTPLADMPPSGSARPTAPSSSD